LDKEFEIQVYLQDPESVLRFIRTILIPYTLAGRIGTRQSSAITTACKVLLEYDMRDLARRTEELEKSSAEMQEQLEGLRKVQQFLGPRLAAELRE